MVNLSRSLQRLQSIRAIVFGDYMLDRYTTGKVRRISPEAPVPVLHVQKEEARPGGAGNVVVNLLALGAKVASVGRLGADLDGELLADSLQRLGANSSDLFYEKGYKTPVKTRLIAEGQQLLRIDNEMIQPLSEEIEREVIERLPNLLYEADIVALSDYGKGFLSDALIAAIIDLSLQKRIPVIVDPKGLNFARYRKATLLKPNLQEAYRAANQLLEEPLEKVADILLSMTQVELLLITRSEAGISLFDQRRNRFDFPVQSKEVIDVTGAGDTVLALVTLALANGLDICEGIQLANLAASLAIERVGCATITLADMAKRIVEQGSHCKVFDEQQLFTLHQILQDKKFSLLRVRSSEGMSYEMLQAIRKVAQSKKDHLVVHVDGAIPNDHFISLLSLLQEVDFILWKESSLQQLCHVHPPSEILKIDGGKILALEKL